MVKRTVILNLLLGCCLNCAVFATEPNDYLIPGKSYMCDGSLSGLRLAYQTFDAGLKDTSCADCNTNRELIFLHAVTRTAMIFIDNNDLAVKDSFLELADAFGVEVIGDYFDQLDVNVPLDPNGRYKIPAGAPDSDEISNIVQSWIAEINDVNGIVAELNSISDSPSDRFRFFFEPSDTGLENPLEVDYGDLLILKGLLLAFKSELESRQAYDVFLDVNETLLYNLLYVDGIGPNDVNSLELLHLINIDVNDPNQLSINNHFLTPYPNLLKVLSTPGHTEDGAAILAQAKQDLINGINYYFDAFNYIAAENVPPGTDPQEDELVYIDPNDKYLDALNQRLTALRDSLVNDTNMLYPMETTKTYNVYDSDSKLIGQMVLVCDWTGLEGESGSLTFTNGIPSPWEIEWFDVSGDGSQFEADLECSWLIGHWQGYFEGTLNTNGDITDVNLYYWGGGGAGVSVLTVYNGKLIAGGDCYVAAWDSNSWQPLGSEFDEFDGDVYALTVYNGQLITGGWFTTAGGVSANNIAAWNGSAWQPLGSGVNRDVYALTVYNGQLIAGGWFTTAGGVDANYIAAWDGSAWQPLGSGMNSDVYALTVYNDQLIAGGNFTTAGGVSANRIAAWNGSSWQPLGSGFNGWKVDALTVYNSQLIAGGWFTTAGGVSANNIAAWNGSAWQPLGSGLDNLVCALTVYNGKLIAGGWFEYGSIAAWDGSTWQPLGSGVNGQVEALTVYNGKLIAGGWFEYGSIAAWDGSTWQPRGLEEGLLCQLISTEVVDVNVNLNPIFGSSPNYPSPVNPRDLLPLFDQENVPITCTFGHGLGNDATLGGILPDMTQRDWATLLDLGFLQGDSDIDCDVDFADYAVLAVHWLNQNCTETDWCGRADIDQSGEVDIFDLAIFAEHWLEGAEP